MNRRLYSSPRAQFLYTATVHTFITWFLAVISVISVVSICQKDHTTCHLEVEQVEEVQVVTRSDGNWLGSVMSTIEYLSNCKYLTRGSRCMKLVWIRVNQSTSHLTHECGSEWSASALVYTLNQSWTVETQWRRQCWRWVRWWACSAVEYLYVDWRLYWSYYSTGYQQGFYNNRDGN